MPSVRRDASEKAARSMRDTWTRDVTSDSHDCPWTDRHPRRPGRAARQGLSVPTATQIAPRTTSRPQLSLLKKHAIDLVMLGRASGVFGSRPFPERGWA